MFEQLLLTNCYQYYLSKYAIYDKMYGYYKGNTDATRDYKKVDNQSNNKINTNFIKKFVKEETSYSVGNKLTYTSKTSNKKIIDDIQYNTSHWKENHDSDLMKCTLIHGIAYELYYTDNENQFCSRIISPRAGFALVDDYGTIVLFMNMFKLAFDETLYIDVWDNDKVSHYTDGFVPRIDHPIDTHIFGCVPVGISQISEELEEDTLYKDIKALQDSYETNLSDISNEISDFRAAYLAFTGVNIEETDLPKMKEQGIIAIPVPDGKVEWIIKNINDSFIQNTLNTIEDKMYQLSSHINNNEAMQSNTSSLAIRARLISLEQKCKLNDGAIDDCIKKRLKMLFIYLKYLKSLDYDYKDIKIKHTPAVPADDTANANIVSQLGDRLSNKTAWSLFSFITNPDNEEKLLELQNKAASIGNDLLNPPIVPIAPTNTVVTK